MDSNQTKPNPSPQRICKTKTAVFVEDYDEYFVHASQELLRLLKNKNSKKFFKMMDYLAWL